MSQFEANADAYRGAHDEGSVAPLMGFMDALDASWQSATKVHSLLAVQQGMRTIEQEQIKKMRDAGLRPHLSLDDSEDVTTPSVQGAEGWGGAQSRYARAAQGMMDGTAYTDDAIAQRDKHIEAVKKERPDLGLMTYAEMFGKVRERAQDIEQRAAGPTTIGGDVGGFLGGAAGAMDPVSNPINAASMAVTGGSGVMARMAVQGAVQAGAETLDIALGPDNSNILLGHPETAGEKAARVGLAVAGGVIGQGIGEAAVAGGRKLLTGRWFHDLPEPKPAPPRELPPPLMEGETVPRMEPGRPINEYPDFEAFAAAHGYDLSPHGTTREAALRTALDLDHVSSELNRWDGPQPHEVAPPRTDTAVIREPERGVTYDAPYQKYIDSLDTVDTIARRIDPELFGKYDRLASDRETLRAQIDAEGKRTMFFEHEEASQGRALTNLRNEIQRIDQQMRDLAPLVTRAYSAADKEWRSTPMDWNTLAFMKRLEQQTDFRFRGDGEPSLTEKPMKLPAKPAPIVQTSTIGDDVPLAKLAPELEARVKLDANADAPTRVAASVAENVTVRDEKIDAFVKSAQKIAKLEDKDIAEQVARLREQNKAIDVTKPGAKEQLDKIEQAIDELEFVTLPDGSKLHMTRDRVPYVDPDGVGREMSVRDFLREMDKDQQALQSVVTCSRPS